mmetsp:Transcript_25650/g.44903  ORF Transcript_25650/g.44903 Transcript_25650/m.44903 type:complete len:273 (-) Transcript_25650:166-984(-)
MRADGILGLGFSNLSDGKLTFIQNLKAQGVISHAVFAFYLSDSDFGRMDETTQSVVTIGGYNLASYAKGALAWIPVYSDTGYWAVALNGISLGFSPLYSTSVVAILDTGTSLILGPALEVLSLTNKITTGRSCFEVDGALVCDCGLEHEIDEYPIIYFKLGSNYFDLKPNQYFYKFGFYCRLLISSLGPGNFWVLGDVFLRRYYTIFDMDNSRIGLAVSINSETEDITANWSVISILLAFAGAIVFAGLCLGFWIFSGRSVEGNYTPLVGPN